MPRSTRNRSVSPQKMTSSEISRRESREMVQDRLYHQIQEMFKDTVDAEVVHLVLTESEWRVDEAIETLFAMSHDEESKRNYVTKVSDLDVIACSLIGNVGTEQKTTDSVTVTTKRESTDPDPVKGLSIVHSTDQVNDSDTSDLECLKKSIAQEMHGAECELSVCGSMSFAGLQSYMDMYKIYGTCIPEVMESIQFKEDSLLTDTAVTEPILSSGSKTHSVLSSNSGVTEITLENEVADDVKADSGSKHSGKSDICSVDRQSVDMLGLAQHTGQAADPSSCVSLLSDADMSQKMDFTHFKSSLEEIKGRTEDSENSVKGGNTSGIVQSSIESQDHIQDETLGNTKDVTLDRDSDVSAKVEAMFSSYMSVQNELEKLTTRDTKSEIKPTGLSVEAPVFVPRISSASVQPPAFRSSGIITSEIPNRFTHGLPDVPPTFMMPKGPKPKSHFTPKFDCNYPPSPPHPKWQRSGSDFYTYQRQPKPLLPVSGLFVPSQNPYRLPSLDSQGPQPLPSSSEHFQTITTDSCKVQSGQKGISYSKAASKEPLFVPEWVKMKCLEPRDIESEMSYAAQVKKVKSYLDQGKLLLVLLRGLPGSGKSFLAREIKFDGVTLSTDDYFYRCGEYRYQQDQLSEAHNWNKTRAQNAMEHKINPVIIDNTNTMEWEMIPYVRLAVAHGYDVEVFETTTPWRFQPKILCKKNSHGVTRETIRKMNQRYQHNVTAAGMLARVAQQKSIKESQNLSESTTVEQTQSDVNANLKLVEYESSSDEEGDTAQPVKKIPVHLPQSIPVHPSTSPGLQKTTKLNINKKQTQKMNENNVSAPISPRKRRQKKRRPSSSKTEVIQTIEEILQSCEDGQMREEDWRQREEEIEALLFMSPVSDFDKQDIQIWLKEKLHSLKGKNVDICMKMSLTDDPVNESKVEKTVNTKTCQTAEKRVFPTSVSGEFKLATEVDKIVSTDLSEMITVAKSSVSADAAGMDTGYVKSSERAMQERSDTKEKDIISESDKNKDDIDELDPWSQTGSKPRRNKRQKNTENQDGENLGHLEFESVRQLEKEYKYWYKDVSTGENLQPFGELNTVQAETVDKEKSLDSFTWEEPKPQRETRDSGRMEFAIRPVDRDSEPRENVVSKLITDPEIVLNSIQKCETLGEDVTTVQDAVKAFDEDICLKGGMTEEQYYYGEPNLRYTCKNVEVSVEEPSKDQLHRTSKYVSPVPGTTRSSANEELPFDCISDCVEVKEVTDMEDNPSGIDGHVGGCKEDVENEAEGADESEEEFISFNSNEFLVNLNEKNEEVGSSDGQKESAEDSFLSGSSSVVENDDLKKHELSFPCDDGEGVSFELDIEVWDHDTIDKDLPIDNSDLTVNHEHVPNSSHRLELDNSVGWSSLVHDGVEEINEKLQSNFSCLSIDRTGKDSEVTEEHRGDSLIIAKGAIISQTVIENDVIPVNEHCDVVGEAPLPQKSSTPRKVKVARKRPGKTAPAFLDDAMKQRFQSESWSSFNVTSKSSSMDLKHNLKTNNQKSQRRSVRHVYSYTGWQDFRFLEEINSSKLLSQIKYSEKYKVLLGKSRDINIEETLRQKRLSQSPEEDKKKPNVSTLEKGCMTDEDDLEVPEDVEFLVNTFPEADETHLRESLQMCQGNVEWTLNLLLDWGTSEPFSTTEKEEISHEMKLKTELMPEKLIKSPEHKSGRCPVSLFDMCRNSIEANNLADINEVQQKVIKTGRQRLERMESYSYERAYSISLSESNLTEVDSRDSVLDELVESSSLGLSDFYVSPGKEFNEGGKDEISRSSEERQSFPSIPATCQEGFGSVVSNWHAEDDWSETERAMADGEAHVKLPVPVELVRDLEELFGPVQSSLHDCEAFEVSIDLRTAKRLFDNLRGRPTCRIVSVKKRETDERARQKQLQDDEALARKLQAEENRSHRSQETEDPSQILGQAKLAALSHLQEPFPRAQHGSDVSGISASSSKKRQACNLMDIMEEERANQHRREKQMRAIEARGDHVAISTKLKRQKLYNHFPGVDQNFLEEIFEANGYNLEDTVRVMQEAVGKGVSPHHKKSVLTEEEQLIKDAKQRSLQDLINKSWKMQEANTKSDYQNWENTGVPDYEDIRGEANIHHRMRNECFQKAQEAFRRGMKDVAAFYSQQGHQHTQKLKEANMRASQKILEHRSSTLMQEGTLDLHGFHVEEAIHILNLVLQEREEEFKIRPDKRIQSLLVITGRGRHSKGGVAKLRPAIINHLNNKRYRYVEQQPGLFKIQLHYRP